MMEYVPFKIIFKECVCEKTLEQIIDEIVKDTIIRIVTKYDNIVYNDEH